MRLPISVNLMLTVARSWYNGRLIFSMEEIAPRTLLLFSCLTASPVCLSITFLPARRVEQGPQYKDIKGSHVVIYSQYFNGISWRVTVVNQIHMESWLKAVFEPPHRTQGELYLSDCKWLHFHCNLCVSFYPVLPPIQFLTVSSKVYHIVMLCVCGCVFVCVCVWGVYLCKEEEEVKHQVYHACVSCILRSGPLHAQHFDEVSASVICVNLDKSDILSLFLLPNRHQCGNYCQYGEYMQLWQRGFFKCACILPSQTTLLTSFSVFQSGSLSLNSYNGEECLSKKTEHM